MEDGSIPKSDDIVGRGHRRIIVCCDGTWNDRETQDPFTNVSTFVGCLAHIDNRFGKLYHQIPVYLDGIGTGNTAVGKRYYGATGIGIERKIREAYKNICTLHMDYNDEIILVGFSRGAYTIQCLARLINDVGLIEASCVDEELPGVFKLWINTTGRSDNGELQKKCRELMAAPAYQTTEDPVVQQKKRLRKPADGIKINMFAAWDNVSALKSTGFLGRSKKPFAFVGDQLPPNVQVAYHALALDERRSNFSPVLLSKAHPRQTLKQCWFLGSHGDVGGSVEASGLANIPLCWMMQQLDYGVKFENWAAWSRTNSRGPTLQRDTRWNSQLRSAAVQITGAKKSDSFTGWWKFLGASPRKVGKSKDPEDETIHFSVRWFRDIAVPEKKRDSEALKTFEHSKGPPFEWKGKTDGQTVTISEWEGNHREEALVQTWMVL
ncbi:hypothetical protein GP486_001059 [Trichoglossum hirsutum]|uniref:T6SS Phospholipase effector Tle1-like catalytic domain-containing protein n=1 Tax=Trichoglossum hirsutum TaxID=265104 RepID=A0A9P8RT22_9PEZI|nr:hypothetical protein GP486_001059 [Trichoglossum hirsutum]